MSFGIGQDGRVTDVPCDTGLVIIDNQVPDDEGPEMVELTVVLPSDRAGNGHAVRPGSCGGVFVACDDFAGSRSSRRRAGPHQSGR